MKNQLISVKALLRNGDRILLLREAAGTNKGKYHFPGGKPAPGESLEEALLRELVEETGISDITIGPRYLLQSWEVQIDGEFYEMQGMFFACETKSTEIALSNEHDHFEWVIPGEHSHLLLVKHGDSIIQRYKEFLAG